MSKDNSDGGGGKRGLPRQVDELPRWRAYPPRRPQTRARVGTSPSPPPLPSPLPEKKGGKSAPPPGKRGAGGLEKGGKEKAGLPTVEEGVKASGLPPQVVQHYLRSLKAGSPINREELSAWARAQGHVVTRAQLSRLLDGWPVLKKFSPIRRPRPLHFDTIITAPFR